MRDVAETVFENVLSHRLEWLRRDALPLWAQTGVDPKGGFYEQVDQAGRPVSALPRRARVVARQTYVFATAVERGWGDYQHLVEHGAQAIFQSCLLESGLSLSTYDPDGAPLSCDFDGYDQAFILLALASIARVLPHRRQEAIDAGQALLRRMQDEFRHPEIGFEEGRPRRTPLLQNPHMHLLEACLAFDQVAGTSSIWRDQARVLVALAITKLSDRSTAAIHEYFDGNWYPVIDPQGGWIEPGHQFEWAWLLWRWHDLTDDNRAASLAGRLYKIGADFGIGASGQVIDALNAALIPRAQTYRLWPQTERLKACLAAAARLECDDRFVALAGATESLCCLDSYLSTPVSGLWYDRLDGKGGIVDAPSPASSLYHLVCALDFAEQFAGNLDRFAR